MEKRRPSHELERWLRAENPEALAELKTLFRGRKRTYPNRLAETVVGILMGKYKDSAHNELYCEEHATRPDGLAWEHALRCVCSEKALVRLVRGGPSLHRAVRSQHNIGLRLAIYVEGKGRELLLQTIAKYPLTEASDWTATIHQLALESFLAESSPVEITDRPSPKQIDSAREKGLISLKASALLKLADYGTGLAEDELRLAQEWLGTVLPGARVRLTVLAQAVGYARRETLTASLSRWRRQVLRGTCQSGRPFVHGPDSASRSRQEVQPNG